MKKKDINLFEVLINEKKPQGLNSKKVQIGIVLGLLFANFFVIGISVLMNQSIKNDIETVKEFLEDETVVKVIETDKKLSRRIAVGNLDIPICEATANYLKITRGFEKNIYDKILGVKPGNVTIKAVSYKEGILDIISYTDDDNPPADYTKALEQLGIFDLVTYRGFVSGKEDNRKVFPISCTVKAVNIGD